MLLKLLYISEINAAERNFGLDLLRAIAICLVLFAHGSFYLPQSPKRLLFYWNGSFFGVELFFVLSGFLIGTILLKIFSNQQNKIDFRSIINFWICRWFRTLPNYFLFLVLNLTVFQWLFGYTPFDIKYLFFLQNLAWPCPYFMSESWSLAVEEWFYLLFPIVMFAFACLRGSRKKVILLSLLFYLVTATAMRFTGALATGATWDLGIRKVVAYRLDSVGYGVLAAYLNYYYSGLLKKYSRLMMWTGSILLLVSVTIFSSSLLTIKETLFNKTLLFTLTSLSMALILPWFKELRVKNRFIIYGVTHMSVVSYSIYLIHFSFVLRLLFDYLSFIELSLHTKYCVYIILTVVLSTFVYKYFERPMTLLREKIVKSETNLSRQILSPEEIEIRKT